MPMKALDLSHAGEVGFAAEVSLHAGTNVNACYACGKCSAGCPLSSAMDYQPHQLIRLVQLDQKDEVLGASAFWLCASCITCSVRCPREVKLAQVMDALREMSRRSGAKSGQPKIGAFYSSFLDLVRSGGRLHELGMTAVFKMRSRDLFSDMDLGAKLMIRGKLKLIPARIKGRDQVAGIFRRVREHEAGGA
jgi:heterodisulfide reductase subunit C2